MVGRRTARSLRGLFASVSSPLFPCLHPFDRALGSDGTDRLRARRRRGYLGEQNGRSVLSVAARCSLLQSIVTGARPLPYRRPQYLIALASISSAPDVAPSQSFDDAVAHRCHNAHVVILAIAAFCHARSGQIEQAYVTRKQSAKRDPCSLLMII